MEKALSMVAFPNNVINLLVRVNHLEVSKIGQLLDMCIVNVSDQSMNLDIQFDFCGSSIARELKKNDLLLLKKINITSTGAEIIGVASKTTTVLRFNTKDTRILFQLMDGHTVKKFLDWCGDVDNSSSAGILDMRYFKG
uniref:Uncharacterized protein n=1 Tax=Clytia hemisphaerica TaxID=252671 RepID=A0A7M5XPD1_9CNID